MTLLQIEHNPHSESPTDLWEELQNEAQIDKHSYIKEEKPDYAGLDALRQTLSTNTIKTVE